MNVVRASCNIARRRYQPYGLYGVRANIVIPIPTDRSIGYLDIVCSRTFFVDTLCVDELGIALCTKQHDPNHSWIGDSSL